MPEISKWWRLKRTFYGNAMGGLVGENCMDCHTPRFYPRPKCIAPVQKSVEEVIVYRSTPEPQQLQQAPGSEASVPGKD